MLLGWALASMAVALIMVPVTAGPVVTSGRTSGRATVVALSFVTSAIVAILTARPVARSAGGELHRPMIAGMATAGVTASAAALLAAMIGTGFDRFIVMGLIASIGIVVVSVPVGQWLARNDRIVHMANATVDPSVIIEPRRSSVGRADFVVVGAIVALLAIGLAIVVPDGPFGHDESVYALKARSWTAGTPDTGWAIFRPLGLSWLGVGVLAVSESEVAFRAVAVGLAVATIATMFVAGRLLFDRPTAILGTLVFMSTASFLRRATEFLNDVVSAGLLLAAMVAIWYHFERKPNAWWIVLAAPFAAAAYYFRYGSALPLGIIAVVSTVVWHRRLIEAWRPILATALALGVLLVPHFVLAMDATGSPFGIFTTARVAVGGGGGGLVDYLGWLPSRLAGPIGASLLALSAVYAALLGWRVRERPDLAPETRTVMFTVATAVIVTIALGSFTHGEPRFVFLPLMLAVLTGARAVSGAWHLLRPRAATVAAGLAAVVLIAGFGTGVWHMAGGLGDVTESRRILVDSSEAIRADAPVGPCAIQSSYVPQLTWYSECATYLFSQPLPATPSNYLVVFANGKRQPTGTGLDEVIATTDGSPFVTIDDPFGEIGDAAIYRFR